MSHYVPLLYDIVRAARRLDIRAGRDCFSASGRLFGGVARDFLAGEAPRDVDIAISFLGPRHLQAAVVSALRDALVREVNGLIRIQDVPPSGEAGGPGYSHFVMVLEAEGIPGQLKIDVVFNPRPSLDFDVNALVLEADERRGALCAVPNPALSGLEVDWTALPRLCADRRFHVFRAERLGADWASTVIRRRLRGMEERGWSCLTSAER